MLGMSKKHFGVIGAGAAGVFGAIRIAQCNPDSSVILLEKHRNPLSKVKISGGGRCNVTHACFDPRELVKNYPRGSKELLGPFHQFQPKDTMEWFKARGVPLKEEEDHRVFPVSDSSESIIRCLLQQLEHAHVVCRFGTAVEDVHRDARGAFILQLSDGTQQIVDRLLVATGSSPDLHRVWTSWGHTMVPQVPSLFTFNCPASPFLDLAGISVDRVRLTLPRWGLEQSGAILFTHWGISGPAALKLSAWGARELAEAHYHADLSIDWAPASHERALREQIHHVRNTSGKQCVGSASPLDHLPKQLWRRLLSLAECEENVRWSGLTAHNLRTLLHLLKSTPLQVCGKTIHKQEFVTAGGIALEEVDFRTMESRICPGLYFAGEALNIDGVTGGFNFQAAWTTSWIAGGAMSR